MQFLAWAFFSINGVTYQFINKEPMIKLCVVVYLWVASSIYWFIYPSSARTFGLKDQPSPPKARFWSKPD